MLHDTLCVSGVGFLYFYCLQDNVKDQQAKQEETTWMAYRRIHGSCSPLVQDTLTIFISEHCNLEPNFLLVYFSYYFSCSLPWPPSSMAPFFPIACHPALSPHLRAYIKSVVAFCKKPGNEKLVKLLGRVWKSVWGMYVDMCLVLFLEISDYEILWTKHALNILEHKNNSKEGQIQSKDWEILRGGGRGGWRAIWFRRSWNPPWTSGLDILFLFANYATFLNALKK